MSESTIISYGRRKTATARCYIKQGKGRIFLNDIPLDIYPNEVVRLKVAEPLLLAGDKIRSTLDCWIYTSGGGMMGQAEAARMSLARALIEYTNSEDLKRIYKAYDRTMLSGDPRSTESEKWMRYSARRWRQKAYR
ncbi:30S ribosomal protein S9 [Sulfuracidifex metallicus]|jgi:small subunit ribosomal protein S9|uniref:30S ribosomal protein S9 n=1 Tax=Sulfuracidifex metallicus DSM 6482 = JCM 9184 TaxID=523847 RepID=A0A6A9QSQ0_SULME|nr:30S ribosomal protein S9 [Sulfuracidifex metallicus]MCY0850852.1 30S ribosomal protein S9 [Sulfuracidifex metallicus]MUN28793.1 30S ribosomal protein S9 [Sulfuracidifex metallicus DSM 6482 = JCM 9184]WOE50691.1 30S ribosomal protein S9 [Sulfuracidifex metallicus DSM 6482 = JCM 9184]